MQTPVLGFVLDSSAHRLRPLLGVPGAAVMGQPLDIDMDIADAALSPRQDYALVLTGNSRDVQLLRLSSGSASLAPIAGVVSAPDRISLSPTGSAAALYCQTTGTVQIVTGLPDAPVLAWEIAVAAGGQQVTALAISDDGRVLAAGLDGAAALLLWTPDGSTASVQLAQGIRAIAFRPRTQDAAAATANNQLFLLADITHNSQPLLAAGADEGIAGPVALAFSSDGQRLFAANSDSGAITTSDLAQGITSTLDCHCQPTGLDRLRGSAVFRLTEAQSSLLLFDGSTNPSRILFVPPDQTAGASALNAPDSQRIGQ